MNATASSSRFRLLLDRVWNQGDLSAIRSFYRDDVVLHYALYGDVMGVDAFEAYVTIVRRQFPDLTMVVNKLHADDRHLTMRYTWSGTYASGLAGDGPPSVGRAVTVTGVGLGHLREDLVSEGWLFENWLSVCQQLGVIPAFLDTSPGGATIH